MQKSKKRTMTRKNKTSKRRGGGWLPDFESMFGSKKTDEQVLAPAGATGPSAPEPAAAPADAPVRAADAPVRAADARYSQVNVVDNVKAATGGKQRKGSRRYRKSKR